MKKEKIKSQELRQQIMLRLNEIDYDDVTDEGLDRIKYMNFNFRAINGERVDIALEEILIFSGLENIKIGNTEVTQELIDVLNLLPELKSIEFVKCRIRAVEFKELMYKLKKLKLTCCEEVDFKYPKIKELLVFKSNINFKDVDIDRLEVIQILGSIVKNARILEDAKLLKRVSLDGTQLFDENGNIIKDLILDKEIEYSHKEEIELYDTEG